MRIQILPLPSVVVGDDVQEPFALVVDQWRSPLSPDEFMAGWHKFRDECGAKAVFVTEDTAEVVDRYAEPAEAGFADREVARLEDFLTSQFPLPHGVPGPDDTPVDVAINLLRVEALRADFKNVSEKLRPVFKQFREAGQRVEESSEGEPVELASLPPEVITLTRAVDRMRDEWAEADVHARYELWMAVHDASDAVYKGPYRETSVAKRPPDYIGPDGREGWM
ncbi:hypothetical protein AB0F88_40020 [Streptosporangium sp. NPDC023963]|uniref:hypothetical protein n=1 Tax=Streptosporangium sp. NPDC023963 TaxID=3155608 RepID=UPI00343557D2